MIMNDLSFCDAIADSDTNMVVAIEGESVVVFRVMSCSQCQAEAHDLRIHAH